MTKLDGIRPCSLRELEALKRRRRKEYRRLLADQAARAEDGKLMSRARAEQLLMYHDSYGRLAEIMRFSGIMSRRSWLRLLGEHWANLDNLFAWHDMLRWLVPGRTTLLLMDQEERAAWQGLPAVVTVYRGCSDINMDGLSWSLCPEAAARFPMLLRYTPLAGRRPLLVTGQVAKNSITAVKLGRSEQEIIALHVRRVSVEPLEVGCQSGANSAELEN